jgi:hypothetical protein
MDSMCRWSVQVHMLLTQINHQSWIRWVLSRTALRTGQEVSLHRHRAKGHEASG